MTAVLERPDDAAPPAVDDAAHRGRLVVTERAVERLASAAAAEAGPAGAPVSRVLGQALGSADLTARPRVRASVSGDLVTLELDLSVPWPSPVAEVADAVRARIAERLRTLAGLRLGHADITVTALPTGRPRRRLS